MFALTLVILANFFWALVNIIDKYLVSRLCSDGNIGSLLLLSSFFPAVLIPFGFIFGNLSNEFNTVHILMLIFSGILSTCWMFFYISALSNNDVVRVIPLFQLTPIFALLFGFLFLNESPGITDMLWATLIIIGAILLSYERTTAKLKFKLILQLVAATLIIALTNTLFKAVAIDTDFWMSLSFQSIGTVLAGIFLFVTLPHYRSSFMVFIKTNLGIGISLNTLNETLVLIGNALFAYASLLAPIFLVQAMNAYQLVFVYIFSVIAVRYFPQFKQDDDSLIGTLQKILSITLIVIGSVFLTLNT